MDIISGYFYSLLYRYTLSQFYFVCLFFILIIGCNPPLFAATPATNTTVYEIEEIDQIDIEVVEVDIIEEPVVSPQVPDINLFLYMSNNELRIDGSSLATANNVDFDTNGVFVDVSTPINNVNTIHWLFSIDDSLVQYTHLQNEQKDIDIRGHTVGLGLQTKTPDAEFNIRISHNIAEQTRNRITTSGFTQQKTYYIGNFDSNETAFFAELKLNYYIQETLFRPFYSLLIRRYHQDGFTEQSTSAAGQVIEAQKRRSRRFSVGFEISQDFEPGEDKMLLPFLQLEYNREFSALTQNGSLSRIHPIAGGAFIVNTGTLPPDDYPEADSIQLAVGLKLQYFQQFQFGLNYDTIYNRNLKYSYIVAQANWLF